MTTAESDVLLTYDDVSIEVSQNGAWVNAVRDLDFEVRVGETVGVVGESGSGKSITFLALLNLLSEEQVRVSGGRILFEGVDLLSLPPGTRRRYSGRRVAMVFQDPYSSLNPTMTIAKQIRECLRRRDEGKRDAHWPEMISLMESVDLTPPQTILKAYPHQLSGGMRQRVVIAMAIALGADLIVADEATTALDVTTQAEILALLQRLQKERALSLVIISHDIALISQHTSRVYVMYAGELVESGRTNDVIGRPQHPYTEALIRATPQAFFAASDADDLYVIPGDMPRLQDLPAACIFSPRCGQVRDACLEKRPDLYDGGPGHVARCVNLLVSEDEKS